VIFKRELKAIDKTFFLFGPRGTGKSTWLEENYPEALYVDLLQNKTYLELLRNPEILSQMIEGINPEWVVIDEIQRLPILLNEVHALIFKYKNKIKFALTGSSARKLKKHEANMLAGRAVTRHFYNLTSYELGKDFNIDQVLKYGTLPISVNNESIEDKIDFLESYIETYLREEIQQEALVRNLLSFNRFLSVSAIMNAQQLNLSNLARETGISRSTVQGYFSILEDTLIGDLLPAFQLRAKVKEVAASKFYFFDPGVVRALSGQLRTPVGREEKGFLFETFIYGELKAANHYLSLGREFYYWRTPSGNEVDFICKKGNDIIGIEVKSTTFWKDSYNQGLSTLLEEKKISNGIGVYLGDKKLKMNNITIYPLADFLDDLHNSKIL
jgi:predicted AAA+ superfamily ATPase